MKLQAFVAAGLGEFLEDVAFEGSAVYDVVFVLLRVKHREAVMVPCGEADIFCSGVFYCLRPLVGVEVDRIESFRGLHVFFGFRSVVKIPFSLSEHGIYSPVDEYSEPVGGKFLLCFLDFFGRDIFFSSRRGLD